MRELILLRREVRATTAERQDLAQPAEVKRDSARRNAPAPVFRLDDASGLKPIALEAVLFAD